jgi:hypothetical protein
MRNSAVLLGVVLSLLQQGMAYGTERPDDRAFLLHLCRQCRVEHFGYFNTNVYSFVPLGLRDLHPNRLEMSQVTNALGRTDAQSAMDVWQADTFLFTNRALARVGSAVLIDALEKMEPRSADLGETKCQILNRLAEKPTMDVADVVGRLASVHEGWRRLPSLAQPPGDVPLGAGKQTVHRNLMRSLFEEKLQFALAALRGRLAVASDLGRLLKGTSADVVLVSFGDPWVRLVSPTLEELRVVAERVRADRLDPGVRRGVTGRQDEEDEPTEEVKGIPGGAIAFVRGGEGVVLRLVTKGDKVRCLPSAVGTEGVEFLLSPENSIAVVRVVESWWAKGK